MWEVIEHLGTPVALIAFFFAVLVTAYKTFLNHRLNLVRSAPKDSRAQLVESLLETYRIKNDNLTREQKYNLLKTIIHEKSKRIKIAAFVLVAMGVLFLFLVYLTANLNYDGFNMADHIIISSDHITINQGVDRDEHEKVLSANEILEKELTKTKNNLKAYVSLMQVCKKHNTCNTGTVDFISYYEKYLYPRNTDNAFQKMVLTKFVIQRERFFSVLGELAECDIQMTSEPKVSGNFEKCVSSTTNKFEKLISDTLDPLEYLVISDRLAEINGAFLDAISESLESFGIAADAVGGGVSDVSRYLSQSVPIPSAQVLEKEKYRVFT